MLQELLDVHGLHMRTKCKSFTRWIDLCAWLVRHLPCLVVIEVTILATVQTLLIECGWVADLTSRAPR